MIDLRKAAVIGCGHVGASIAFSLMQRAIFSELVLIDMSREKAEGEAMDLCHGLPYTASMEIHAGDYADLGDCALVIVTAGANQRPGESRLDLIGKNVAILRDVIRRLQETAFAGILLIVSNPVDILTCEAQRLSGYPASRVIGSGTVLDTARLKQLLGSRLGVDSRSVHAVIIGEHGDSELAVWSGANVSGIALDAFCALPDAAIASSGYVVHTLQAALYCLNNARSFRDCALAAVNLGDDTDTTAAVAGSLAGIAWGEGSIPAAWRMLLPRRGEMERLLEIFYYSQITKK